MTTHDDAADRLAAYLGYMAGRPLKLREILEALQMSKTRYYAQRDEGTLVRPDNLMRAARNLNINAVDLLARFGLIGAEEVLAYADALVPVHPRGSLGIGEVQAAASTATSAAPARRGARGRRVRSDIPPLR
ncbi:immunity repressor [Mycobacterium phage Marshawn]|uniref:Immunity repressor n=1 Tax=Mycobacterium phage Marshawn TaxID=2652423 RepID=A0A5P8D8R8_9CAUD|nr:transcriptional repressor [Mycobacterium phage Marshawn]QFP94832.1 immunity repressor [Mycobacterium phage Marshawn]